MSFADSKGHSPYDIAIIGGGITGAAILRDAALRGLNAILIEKGDFAEGTSSRSSKLVHGGVRYLEQLEFGLVRESVRERALLWKLAPQLVHPLPFLFPAFKKSRNPLWKLNLGLWLYDILALFKTPTRHKLLGRRRTLLEEPMLKSDNLKGAVTYWDGSTDDARLTLALVLDSIRAGGTALSRLELKTVAWGDIQQDKAHTLHLEDKTSGKPYSCLAKTIVYATGPWTDKTPGLKELGFKPHLAPTRGSHIVVSSKRLPLNYAVVHFHPTDGRVLFSIPWGDRTVIGTTDIFDKAAPETTVITGSEIDYLIAAANDYFPSAKLSRGDVISTWSGLRPLIKATEGLSASDLSREHYLEYFLPGAAVIAGGKLTTHREMAEQCLDLLLKSSPQGSLNAKGMCSTHEQPLGILTFPQDTENEILPGCESEGAKMSLRDVEKILQTQMVLTLEDFMVRRTSIFYKEKDNGLGLLPFVKEIFMQHLNWSENEWLKQSKLYEEYVQRNVRTPLAQ